MSSNSSNSAGAGNTKTAPKKKQESAKKCWCLTLNNYSLEEYNDIKELFSSNSSNKWIIGKEKGEGGTPHLQMYCNFADKIRFTAIKKINPRLHIEVKYHWSTERQNLKYCSKEGDFESNVKVPKPLKILLEEDLYEYQKLVVNLLKEEPNNRDILWFFGDYSIGKTQLCKYLIHHKLAFGTLEGEKRHILSVVADNIDEEAFIFYLTADESIYQKHSFFDCIEKVKDGLFMSHFGTDGTKPVIMNSPHILVFANAQPDLSKTNMDPSRFQIYRIMEGNVAEKVYMANAIIDSDSDDG